MIPTLLNHGGILFSAMDLWVFFANYDLGGSAIAVTLMFAGGVGGVLGEMSSFFITEFKEKKWTHQEE